MAIEQFPIEAGHVLMFARAIGDPNPIYADADVAAASEVGVIPAPPTFVTASAQFDPDYPLRPKPGQPWFGSGREATGAKPTVPSGGKSEDGGGGGTSLADAVQSMGLKLESRKAIVDQLIVDHIEKIPTEN